MSDQVPESYFPPREPDADEARSNVLFGLGLFAISLLLLGAVVGVAFVYLALD